MSQSQNQVFADFGAFLHALLPQAQGFLFHDRHKKLFWHDNLRDPSILDDQFQRLLNRVIKQGELPGDEGRIALTGCTAYLIRIVTDKGRVLGVVTVLAEPEVATMSYLFCVNLLQPALRSISRELSLRLLLVESRQQISLHSGDHEFLRTLGREVRTNGRWELAVENILHLCVNHLQLDGAVFLSTERKLSLVVGPKPVELPQAERLLESMGELVAQAGGNAADAMAQRPSQDPAELIRSWPILEEGRRLGGILLLSRSTDSNQWEESIIGLVSFVASTIEHVLERSFDALTGLINWNGFEVSMDAACADLDHKYTVMYLDIDQLHVVNDTFGRATGDQVLRKFGQKLNEILSGHTVTRVSGGSFAALLKAVDLETATELGNKLCQAAHELDYASGGQIVRPTVSVGVAPLAPGDDGLRSVLVPAQIACQAAKDRGAGRVEVYVSSDLSIVRRMDELSQVGSIRNAIEAGRLVLYAQPIVRLGGASRIANYEVLVRMLDSNDRPMPPSEFLGAAERYQLMLEIDRWVVSQTIDSLAAGSTTSDGRKIELAINLSGQSLGSDQFREFVTTEFERTKVPASQICFEITETVAVANLRKAQTFMNEMKSLGCHFSLDDFGTGLSSFAYLKMFPVDKLKIDGSFVHDVASNHVSRSMVSAIAEIAKVMELETVAEYVQDEPTLTCIRELGVNWAQGFHVGEPLRLSHVARDSMASADESLGIDLDLLDSLPT